MPLGLLGGRTGPRLVGGRGANGGVGGVTPRAPSPAPHPSPLGILERSRRAHLPALTRGSESLRSFFERWRTGVPSLRDHPETQRQRDKERPGLRGRLVPRREPRQGESGEGAREAVSERGKVSVRRKVGVRGAGSRARSGGETRRGAEAADQQTHGSEGRNRREENSILTFSLRPSSAPPLSAPGSPPLSRRTAR